MKKIKYLLLVCILSVLTLSSFSISAFAEETESVVESVIESTIEETESNAENDNVTEDFPENEETPKQDGNTDKNGEITFTQEQLTELLNSVLNDNQKETANKITEIISSKFNLSTEKIYIIVACLILVGVLCFIVLGKYINKTGKVKALQEQVTALSAMASASEQDNKILKQLLDKFSTDGIETTINTKLEKVKNDIVKELKLDSDTISQLLKGESIIEEQDRKIINALKIVLERAGQTSALNELCSAPEKSAYEKTIIENRKMRTVLGDEAVQKILAE